MSAITTDNKENIAPEIVTRVCETFNVKDEAAVQDLVLTKILLEEFYGHLRRLWDYEDTFNDIDHWKAAKTCFIHNVPLCCLRSQWKEVTKFAGEVKTTTKTEDRTEAWRVFCALVHLHAVHTIFIPPNARSDAWFNTIENDLGAICAET